MLWRFEPGILSSNKDWFNIDLPVIISLVVSGLHFVLFNEGLLMTKWYVVSFPITENLHSWIFTHFKDDVYQVPGTYNDFFYLGMFKINYTNFLLLLFLLLLLCFYVLNLSIFWGSFRMASLSSIVLSLIDLVTLHTLRSPSLVLSSSEDFQSSSFTPPTHIRRIIIRSVLSSLFRSSTFTGHES